MQKGLTLRPRRKHHASGTTLERHRSRRGSRRFRSRWRHRHKSPRRRRDLRAPDGSGTDAGDLGPEGTHDALSRAAPRRGTEGRGVHRRTHRLHVQRHLRRRATRGRTLHRRAGQRLLLVPLAHPGRTDEPLRPRHAALCRLRLQGQDHRRPRLRLADHVRGSEAVLRQGGTIHRHGRHGREHPQRTGRDLSTARRVARPRRARAALVREDGHPRRARASGRHHAGDQRPAAVPLLRPVRPRLRRCLELRVELRPDLPRDEDRPRAGAAERDGARADHRRVAARSPRSRTSTRRLEPSAAFVAARSSSRPARANPAGCCSTRNRRDTRRDSRTAPAWSDAT